MTETVPSLPGGDMSTADFLARAPEVSLLALRVTEIGDPGAGLREIRLTGDALADFTYQAGQDLMFLVDTSGGRTIRRRYTIRRFDPDSRTVDVSVAIDSSGPGARWASALRIGDEVEAIGPRGKITFAPDVDWHLFIGDDVAVPAIAAMVEALPSGAHASVIAEIASVAGEEKIDPSVDIELSWTWLHRDGRAAGELDALLDAAGEVAIPEGMGWAYVFGEATVVARISAALRDRGIPAEQISAKAYWGRGRANASHGEPVRDR